MVPFSSGNTTRGSALGYIMRSGISQTEKSKHHLALLLWGFPGGPVVKNSPAKQGTQIRSLRQDDPLEKEMATHSSILAWEIPWTESTEGYSVWSRKKSDMTEQLERDLSPNSQVGHVKFVQLYMCQSYLNKVV